MPVPSLPFHLCYLPVRVWMTSDSVLQAGNLWLQEIGNTGPPRPRLFCPRLKNDLKQQGLLPRPLSPKLGQASRGAGAEGKHRAKGPRSATELNCQQSRKCSALLCPPMMRTLESGHDAVRGALTLATTGHFRDGPSGRMTSTKGDQEASRLLGAGTYCGQTRGSGDIGTRGAHWLSILVAFVA